MSCIVAQTAVQSEASQEVLEVVLNLVESWEHRGTGMTEEH